LAEEPTISGRSGRQPLARLLTLGFVFLLVEFLDELHYGLQSAALPAIHNDLALTYAQIGLLLGLPKITGTVIEPFLMLLGDSTWRKQLVVGGGIGIILALLMTAGSTNFLVLLLAFIISFPASGAFVSLSQATLMDLNPGRTSQMMARWTVYGSLGNLLGPAMLAAGFAVGLSWRWSYSALALLALGLVIIIWQKKFPPRPQVGDDNELSGTGPTFLELPGWMWRNLRQALSTKTLLRWVFLLEISDLMLDVFISYAALYFADVAGLTPAQTSLVILLIMLAGLIADLILVQILEHFPGRRLVRLTAAISIPLFMAFLLAPWVPAKIALAVLLRFSTTGWYQVMQGEAYAAVPMRSGTVAAINSIAGLFGGLLVWLVGTTANQFGLSMAMWLLLAAPLALVIFVPKSRQKPDNTFD
jgi:MFS transporter, FSR family, fosmidomycin resistance protein